MVTIHMPEGTHSFPSWPGANAGSLSRTPRLALAACTASDNRRETLAVESRRLAGREGIEPP
jgi:hypothetical protein